MFKGFSLYPISLFMDSNVHKYTVVLMAWWFTVLEAEEDGSPIVAVTTNRGVILIGTACFATDRAQV